MKKLVYTWAGLLANVLLLGMTWYPLPTVTSSIVSLLVEMAREMAVENVGLQSIINYQTTLLPYSESNPE
ncbi:MAG: hypothetical protein F4203_02825 [Rhodobacteraceae bacterium]|nr:hypothetical protein [Paracoccaceae bacterium]